MVPAGGARDARLSPSAPSPVTPRPSREASCRTRMGSGGGRQSRGGRERRRVPARRRASARQTQRLARWDVKAQGGVTKQNVPEASGDDGVRARGTAGRGFAPRGRRAGCPFARSARFPRVAPLATTGTRVPPESIARHFTVTLAEVPSRAQPRTSQSIVERRLLASSTRVSHLSQRRDQRARSRSTYARNVPRHSRRAPSMRPVTRGTGVP